MSVPVLFYGFRIRSELLEFVIKLLKYWEKLLIGNVV